MISKKLTWVSPDAYAHAISKLDTDFVFFWSTRSTTFTGDTSFIGFHPKETIQAKAWDEFESKLSNSDPEAITDRWFGYLGYELAHSLEDIPETLPTYIKMPSLVMMRFSLVLVFDEQEKTVRVCADSEKDLCKIPDPLDVDYDTVNDSDVISISSNMTKATYLNHVSRLHAHISNGDIYQANLTRKFFGEVFPSPSKFPLFCRLCRESPASYSAYIRLGNYEVLSSSPEQFLSISNDQIASRPIKGSSSLLESEALKSSDKDRAENLMIVDLMRHDLSKTCVPSSVQVSGLFDITTYKTIAHMSSTITGRLKGDISALGAVKAAFPPGSMTGAPKLMAMRLCSELEQMNRGVYSGAIGWFQGAKDAELSVVIRTLVFENNRFEFQVGGAITADSEPEKEWQETKLKAQGICSALNLSLTQRAVF